MVSPQTQKVISLPSMRFERCQGSGCAVKCHCGFRSNSRSPSKRRTSCIFHKSSAGFVCTIRTARNGCRTKENRISHVGEYYGTNPVNRNHLLTLFSAHWEATRILRDV